MAASVIQEYKESEDELFAACEEGTWQQVLDCLNMDERYNLSWSNPENGFTALHYACMGNNIDVVEKMFRELNEEFKAACLRPSKQDETPLLMACRLGHTHVVEILIQGSEGTLQAVHMNSKRQTPLHVACMYGFPAVVEVLLGFQDINAKDVLHEVPLHKAIHGGHIHVVRALLEAGPDVNCKNQEGYGALYISLHEKQWTIMKLILQQSDVDVDAEDASGKTALHTACNSGNSEAVDLLLASGADTRASCRDHKTPLHYATETRNIEIIKKLLEKGANVNSADINDQTALDLARDAKDNEILRALLLH